MAGPLGTLIVVVLKARNLPNKQRIGKQDPYATCTYLSHRKRTKTDKRGGQHPVWDDELRFDIYDNPKDAMASASVSTTASGGVVPVKSNPVSTGSVGAASLKELRVAVYADDPRDPDLIGEGKVDLTETLKKGEFDDWVTVTNKGKYQGEIYLEMTFYSAKPPPDKLQTPTGPIRAGVFEASSPGSGKRPTPNQQPITSHSFNKTHSPSPSCTPLKTIHPDSVPAALRAGRPTSGPISTGHLPFPGEPSTSKNASINSRQRSTGSLSMPTPDFGPQDRPPSRAPSRNHTLDRTDHLVDSMNSVSLSGRTSANKHAYLSQPKPPEPLNFPNSSSHQRPYRHSFSGHPHVQPDNSISQSHSVSPPIHNLESAEDRFHEHSNPQYMDSSYPDRFPQSPQPQPAARPSLGGRRPLPIPGGDSVHRPQSAWGNTQNVPGGQRYANEVPVLSQQPPPGPYAQYPDDYERPAIPVMTNNGPTYPPQMQYVDGHNQLNGPPNGVHQQQPPTNRPPPHVAYSSQQPQYYPTPPPPPPPQNQPFAQQPQLSGHVAAYNLPPPPPGQAPVPIHEVFASSSGRPLPPANPNGYLPPGSFPAQQHTHVTQPNSRPDTAGGTVYNNYAGPPQMDRFQPPYNPPIENNHNLYTGSQNGAAPPHVPQYQGFQNQGTNGSISTAPPSVPPTTQMYYHQPTYAPLPPSTPEPGYNATNNGYPEHNNPFHNPHIAAISPGNVYSRPSLSNSNSAPLQPLAHPNLIHYSSYNLPTSTSSTYPQS